MGLPWGFFPLYLAPQFIAGFLLSTFEISIFAKRNGFFGLFCDTAYLTYHRIVEI